MSFVDAPSAEETAHFEQEAAASANAPPEPAPAPEPAAPPPAVEPVVSVAPPPEPAAAPPAAETPPAGHVPLAALHESRQREKAAKDEAAQLRQLLARVQAPAAPPPQAQAPQSLAAAVDTDPVAVVRQLAQIAEQNQAQQAQQAQIVQVLTASDAAEREYARDVPDYAEALDFLRARRMEQLQLTGMPQNVAIQALQREAAETANMAFQRGKNPGEVFYAFAKTYGWQPKSAQPPAPPPAPAAPPAPVVNPAAVVQQVEQGRAVHKNVGGGDEPEADLSLAAASKLSGAAFDAWWEKHARRLMH